MSLTAGVLEEVFTKKPYARHLVLILLEGGLIGNNLDLSKLARECLKNLTSEDFMHLAQTQRQQMEEYENRYDNLHGNKLENELAKIMKRYANEGRPEGWVAEKRPKVTFEEAQTVSNGIGGNRI